MRLRLTYPEMKSRFKVVDHMIDTLEKEIRTFLNRWENSGLNIWQIDADISLIAAIAGSISEACDQHKNLVKEVLLNMRGSDLHEDMEEEK